jgi:hypothetical protein
LVVLNRIDPLTERRADIQILAPEIRSAYLPQTHHLVHILIGSELIAREGRERYRAVSKDGIQRTGGHEIPGITRVGSSLGGDHNQRLAVRRYRPGFSARNHQKFAHMPIVDLVGCFYTQVPVLDIGGGILLRSCRDLPYAVHGIWPQRQYSSGANLTQQAVIAGKLPELGSCVVGARPRQNDITSRSRIRALNGQNIGGDLLVLIGAESALDKTPRRRRLSSRGRSRPRRHESPDLISISRLQGIGHDVHALCQFTAGDIHIQVGILGIRDQAGGCIYIPNLCQIALILLNQRQAVVSGTPRYGLSKTNHQTAATAAQVADKLIVGVLP